MPATLQASDPSVVPFAEPQGIHRLRFSRAMYHAMGENLLSKEGQRYELFDGDILEQMPQKQPHTALVMRLLFALTAIFGEEFLWCQMPIVLSDDTEPEPDVFVASQERGSYADVDNPPASEVRLVVEVSVSTLEFDAGAKAVRYAQSGIPECWVLDVAGRALLVHRDPTPDGYASVMRLAETETVSPLAAPQASLNIVDFLP